MALRLRQQPNPLAEGVAKFGQGFLDGLVQRKLHEQQRREHYEDLLVQRGLAREDAEWQQQRGREEAAFQLDLLGKELQVRNAANLDLAREQMQLQQEQLQTQQRLEVGQRYLGYTLGQVESEFRAGHLDDEGLRQAVYEAVSQSDLYHDPAYRPVMETVLRDLPPEQQIPALRRLLFDAESPEEDDGLMGGIQELERMVALGYVPREHADDYIQAFIRKQTAGTADRPGMPNMHHISQVAFQLIDERQRMPRTEEDRAFQDLPYHDKMKWAWPLAKEKAQRTYEWRMGRQWRGVPTDQEGRVIDAWTGPAGPPTQRPLVGPHQPDERVPRFAPAHRARQWLGDRVRGLRERREEPAEPPTHRGLPAPQETEPQTPLLRLTDEELDGRPAVRQAIEHARQGNRMVRRWLEQRGIEWRPTTE